MTRPAFRSLASVAAVAAATSAALALGQGGRPAQQPADAIGGLSFSPAIFRLAVNPGQSGSLELHLSAPKERPVLAVMNLRPTLMEDWTYRSRYGAGHVNDATVWFPQRSITALVKSTTGIKQALPYRVPLTARGSYWTTLVLEPKPQGATSAAAFQYEVPILFVVGKPEPPNLKVGTPKLTGSPSRASLVLPYMNDGAGFASIGATTSVTHVASNRVVARGVLSDRNLLPRTKRNLSVSLPKLEPGRHRVQVNTSIGSRRLPPVISEFEVVGNEIRQGEASRMLAMSAVAISPQGLNVFILPGASKLETVKLRNGTNRSISLRVSATNVEQSAAGAIGIGSGKPPDGLAVTVTPSTLTVRPGATISLRVLVKTSRASRGDQWFGLAIGEPKADSLPQQLLGVVSLKNTLKPQLALQAGKFHYNPQGNPLMMDFAIANSGNSGVAPTFTAQVVDPKGRLVNKLVVPSLGEGGIIPGAVLRTSVMLPPYLKAGRYAVEISGRYTEKDFARLTVPFTVKGAKK